jgi:nickel transport protein
MPSDRRRCLAGLTVLGGLGLLAPAWAGAHRIDVSARSADGQIVVQARYHDGVPVRAAAVTVTDPDGNPLAEGTTDANGEFLFTLAAIPAHVNVVVDTGDGHRGAVTRTRADLTGAADAEEGHEHEGHDSPAGQLSADDDSSADHDELHEIEAALTRIERELHELAHELEHLSARQPGARFERVLAGVGFILGLTGIAAYCLARRGQPH